MGERRETAPSFVLAENKAINCECQSSHKAIHPRSILTNSLVEFSVGV